MAKKKYIIGCPEGELDRIYITTDGVRAEYNGAVNMVALRYLTSQTVYTFRNPCYAHLTTEDLNHYFTFFGYRIKNNSDPNDKNKFLLYQYKPTRIVSETSYGYTMDRIWGIYRYVIADITDGVVTVLQTVYEYNAGSAALNACGGFDPRPHGGVRSIDQYCNVVMGIDGTIGTYLGVIPCAFVQYVDGTSEYTAGNNSYTIFALPFSRISSYDPTPDVSNDPYKPGGTSGEGGGNGDFDPQSDPVPRPTKEELNPVSAMSSGLVKYFHPNKANLVSLAMELYDDNMITQLVNYFKDLFAIIAGLYMLPVGLPTGNLKHPKVGNLVFNVEMPLLTNQYVEKDCGSIYVGEFYGGAFDYSPYTKMSIFLPFIGVRELNVDEIMGKWLHVVYMIDIESGDCIAYVMIGDGTAGSDTVRYQFPGNCAQQIPFSTLSFSDAVKNAISFATVAVSSVITAGATNAAVGAAGAALESGAITAKDADKVFQASAAINTQAATETAASGLSAVMGAKPIVERAGSIGANIGFMSVLKPFLIRTIPRQSLPDHYAKFYGYPLNMESTLGGMTGYTVVDSVKLHGIPGVDSEIAEIETLLKGGVVL